MQKTVLVEVSRAYRHRLYKKVIQSKKRYMVHDEMGAKVGDKVLIVESQPISRHKRWVVEEIIQDEFRIPEVIEEAEEGEVVAEVET
jgi:small subunit ribosomal protein S17